MNTSLPSAMAEFRKSDLYRARALAVQRLQDNPDDRDGTEAMAHLALSFGRPDEAQRHLDRLIKREPQNVTWWVLSIRAYEDWLKPEQAVAMALKGLQVLPHDPQLWDALGRVEMRRGNIAAAAKACRKGIQIEPRMAISYWWLALMGQLTRKDPLYKLARQVARDDIPGEARAWINLALSRAVGPGEPKTYWAYIAKAKAAALEDQPDWRPEVLEQRVAGIKDTFSADFFARHTPPPAGSHKPIFIVGMPRSGTTLADRIVSGEPDAVSGGELSFIRPVISDGVNQITDKTFPLGFEDLDAKELQAITKNFYDCCNVIAPDRGYVISKNPTDFLDIGAIHALLPEARVIHMRRDPLDTCFSILINPMFSALFYLNDMKRLAHFYIQYRDIMAHWENVLPGYVLTVDYEDLVANPEPNIRRMVDHCGLEWRDDFLEPQSRTGYVRTPSIMQVRQPIAKSSTSRKLAHKFRSELKPLIRALREGGVDVSSR